MSIGLWRYLDVLAAYSGFMPQNTSYCEKEFS